MMPQLGRPAGRAQDRDKLMETHGYGRLEDDALFHLQLLDLALLSQADVVAGAFGSTFIKTALQAHPHAHRVARRAPPPRAPPRHCTAHDSTATTAPA